MKDYVAATHKLSFTLLAIVFLSWQIAQIHASRIRMLNEAKELLTIETLLRPGNPAFAQFVPSLTAMRYLEQRREINPLTATVCDEPVTRMQYVANGFAGIFELALMGDSAQITGVRIPNASSLCGMWPKLPAVHSQVESFGKLSLYAVNMPCQKPMTCQFMTAFVATGSDPGYGSWSTGLFSRSDPSIKPEVNRLGRNLGIDFRLTGAERIEAIQTKLFSQKIKIPFLDEVAVRTEFAVWVLALGSFFVLVNMRNQLQLALTHPVPSHETPWILLDASTAADRMLAGLWWFLLAASGAVTTFAMILAATDANQAALNPPPLVNSLFSFLIAAVVGIANIWASLECAGYLALLRQRRQAYHRGLRAAVKPWKVEP